MIAQSRTFKAGILASGQFLTSCTVLIAFAVLSRAFSVRDYATYRQTMLAYGFAAPLLMLGLPQALYYFLPGEKQRARAVLLENLLLLSLMGFVFSLFLLLGGNRLLAWRFNNPALEKTLLVLAPYPLFMLPAAALGACLMARDRVKQVAVFNVISRLVLLAIVLAASLIWRTPLAAILGTVIAAAVVLLPALSLMLRSTREGEARLSIRGMSSQLKFSVPLGLAGALATISYTLDKVIVAAMCPPEQYAVYANGAMEIPLIAVVTGSVTSVLLPDIARLHKEGRVAEAIELWKRSAEKTALIILPTMCLLFCMAPEVISVLFSSKYADSAIPFRFYLCLMPIRVVTFGAMLQAAGRSDLLLWRSAGTLLINLVLSIILVHIFGYIGAVISAILTTYLYSVPVFVNLIGREYKVTAARVLPYVSILKILVVSAVAAAVLLPNMLLHGISNVVRLAVFSPLYATVVIYLFVSLGLVDRTAVLAPIRRIFR